MYIHEDGVGYGAEWHHSNTFRYGYICTIARMVIIKYMLNQNLTSIFHSSLADGIT